MTIRAKLTLSLTLLFAGGLGAVGYILVRLERTHLVAESSKDVEIIENTIRRAARDALVQRDEILLLSYIKFLDKQFPALAYCRATWLRGKRTKSYRVGKPSAEGNIEERTLRVRDPTDPRSQVKLDLGIDQNVLRAGVDKQIGRLRRDILRLFGIALIVGIVFSDWFARKLTRPLAALSKLTSEIGQGKLGVRLNWKSKDEVGELVDGVNEMSARLEELEAMKRDFVSAVTHELRSPLGAIESFLSLIERKLGDGQPASAKQVGDYLTRIKTNVRRLSGFISDLLDVAKIERGKMECTLQPMKVQAVASDVIHFFEARGKEQGVGLASRLDPNMGPVNGDSERLRQVFVNLVSNALKFTPRGGQIWIQAEQYRENGKKFIELAVCDTGRGMDAADLKNIFRKFEQGKSSNTRVGGSRGTGLGLFIVKSIVEAHGGQVSVRSEVGKGTQFLFNLSMA